MPEWWGDGWWVVGWSGLFGGLVVWWFASRSDASANCGATPIVCVLSGGVREGKGGGWIKSCR